MRILGRISLRTKLILLMAMSGLALAGSISACATLMRQRMMNDRVATIKAAVTLTMSTAQSLENEVLTDKLNREDALSEFRDYLHVFRFGSQDDYLVVLSMDGRVVVHGARPEREGELAAVVQDANGTTVTDLAKGAVRSGTGGLISYRTLKPGTKGSQDKLSYVGWFEPWQLMFIAGSWTEDVERAHRLILLQLGGVVGVILLITLLGAWVVSADISNSLGTLRTAMERLASGDLTIDTPGTDRGDEVGGMANAVVVFQAHMINARHLSAERELSERRLRDYVATASDWHWETDADFRFTMIAAQAREHGIDPESLLGLDQLTEDDAADVILVHRAMLNERKPFDDCGMTIRQTAAC